MDCSWCCAERGEPCTDSPGICERHKAMLLQQSEERKREREEKERKKAA